jgi:hypothetical protein
MSKDENAHDLDELVQHSLGPDGIRPIVDWVARFSYWVDPDVVKVVPLVFPKTRRARSKEEKRSTIDGVAVWANEPASRAFWTAYGARPSSHTPRDFRNFILCHIYEGSTQSPKHFTHLANLTVFPRCLESFSEWTPIRDVLKWQSYALYRYTGLSEMAPKKPSYFPARWPGVRILSPANQASVVKTLEGMNEKWPAYYARVAGSG